MAVPKAHNPKCTLTPDEIRKLYEQCKAKETALKERRRPEDDRIRDIFRWGLSFREQRHFRAATAKIDSPPIELIAEGEKYLTWLELLKKAPDKIMRWYWIAQLLSDEGVTTPDQILPRKVFNELTKKGRERLQGFSWTSLQHADLVQCWLPYCEALLFDAINLKKASGDIVQGLEKLGYQDLPELFPWSQTWHSPVPFTCEWLDMRGGVPMVRPREHSNPARALENAYSRIYKGCCYICGLPAKRELKRDGVGLLRCDDHLMSPPNRDPVG
jgi:hypothetical protein